MGARNGIRPCSGNAPGSRSDIRTRIAFVRSSFWQGARESNSALKVLETSMVPRPHPKSRRVYCHLVTPRGVEPRFLASETSALSIELWSLGTRRRIRTPDLSVRSRALYLLSYAGSF